MGKAVEAQLNKLVAENLLSFDQKFWVRLATRNDTAEPGDKARSVSPISRSLTTPDM